MSQSESENNGKLKKVVISADDCRATLDFWTHFDIPIPQGLSEAVESFSKEQTLENQDKVKLEICKAIATSDHEAFKDEIFSKIVEECANVSFEMQFDKDLEETLSEDNK